MVTSYQFRWTLFGTLLFASFHLHAETLRIKPLFEILAGEPPINVGSDGLLTQLPEANPAEITSGQRLYKQHCATCHGDNLQGQRNPNVRLESGLLPAPAHDESGHTWHHADDQLFEIVKYGATVAMRDPEYRSAMPSFKELLSDDEILSILVFIRSSWPKKLQDWQTGANDAQTGKQWRLEPDN